MEMQAGAQSVSEQEAKGAEILRRLELERFRTLLKRNWLSGPGQEFTWTSRLDAQTTLQDAQKRNKQLQESRGSRSKILEPTYDAISAWSPHLREGH